MIKILNYLNVPKQSFVHFLFDSIINDISINEEKICSSKECRNIKSAKKQPQTVDTFVEIEVEKGFVRHIYLLSIDIKQIKSSENCLR